MAAAVIDLKRAEDPRDVVHRAVEALAAGKIVAIPTETVYGVAASALSADAVSQLLEAKKRSNQKAFALAIKGADDALDYVPEMSSLARRLARRCWPGPLTLVLDDAHADSVISRLPSSVQAAVIPTGTVGLRVPAHSAALQILRLSAGPMVLTSANISGQSDPLTADQVQDQLGDVIDLIVDDGPCKFGQPSSVVQVQGNRLQMLREGVVSLRTLQRMSVFLALLVCTGNTCRSPMAEKLLKRRLAQRLGCPIDELDQRGVSVVSAGIAAMPGGGASDAAITVLADQQLDLRTHSSQPVTDHLVRHADLILTMTGGHLNALLSQWPDLMTRAFLIRKDGRDISDPIGQSLDVYRRCAEQIDQHLQPWVDYIIQDACRESE